MLIYLCLLLLWCHSQKEHGIIVNLAVFLNIFSLPFLKSAYCLVFLSLRLRRSKKVPFKTQTHSGFGIVFFQDLLNPNVVLVQAYSAIISRLGGSLQA